MKSTKLTKSQKNRIVSMAKNVLYARRNGHLKKEQKYYEILDDYLSRNDINLSAGEATKQVAEHLKKTSIAARFNGLV